METDLDVVTSLMIESLYTWEQEMWVKVIQAGKDGKLAGHLPNKTGDLLYQGLMKEGIVKVKSLLYCINMTKFIIIFHSESLIARPEFWTNLDTH